MMQKMMGVLIAVLVLVDAFFVSYALGLNMHRMKVVDPALAPREVATVATDTSGTTSDTNVVTTDTSGTSSNNVQVSDTSGSSTAATAESFTDLKETDKRLQSSLEKAADAGILDPSKDKQFRPNDPVTRADFARWMVRIRQTPKQEPNIPTYTDVDKGNPYYAEIEGATKAMMVQGYNVKDSSEKQFKPDQNITRQEFAVMYGTFSGKRSRAEQLKKEDIDKYLRYNPSQTSTGELTYKDVGDVDDWALKWVAVANQAGVLEQCFAVDPYSSDADKKYLHPQQQMTRAEAVNILVKLYGAQSRSAVTDAKTETTDDAKPAAADRGSEKKPEESSEKPKDDAKASSSEESTKTE